MRKKTKRRLREHSPSARAGTNGITKARYPLKRLREVATLLAKITFASQTMEFWQSELERARDEGAREGVARGRTRRGKSQVVDDVGCILNAGAVQL